MRNMENKRLTENPLKVKGKNSQQFFLMKKCLHKRCRKFSVEENRTNYFCLTTKT